MDVLVIGGIFREVFDADTKPTMRYGGSGLTASVAAARFGVKTALASYVGADDEGPVHAILGEAGVYGGSVVPVDGMCGIFAYPTDQGDKQPWPMYRPAEAVPTATPTLPKSKVVLAFGFPDFDPIAEGWLDGLTSQTTLIWDRQGWLSRARNASGVLRLAASKRIYLANADEASADAQRSSFEETMAAQPPDGFDVAAIKLGETGVVIAERNTEEVILTAVPAYPVNTNCTVGTGERFRGGTSRSLSTRGLGICSCRVGMYYCWRGFGSRSESVVSRSLFARTRSNLRRIIQPPSRSPVRSHPHLALPQRASYDTPAGRAWRGLAPVFAR